VMQALKIGFARRVLAEQRRGSNPPQANLFEQAQQHVWQKRFYHFQHLGFQRLDGAQAGGETPLHAPQSRRARPGGVAGGVALEQLPRLFHGRSRTGGGGQVGRPQDENSSASRVRAESGAAGGADGPLLETREKWRTHLFFCAGVQRRGQGGTFPVMWATARRKAYRCQRPWYPGLENHET
jgi:hypothetical protein